MTVLAVLFGLLALLLGAVALGQNFKINRLNQECNEVVGKLYDRLKESRMAEGTVFDDYIRVLVEKRAPDRCPYCFGFWKDAAEGSEDDSRD